MKSSLRPLSVDVDVLTVVRLLLVGGVFGSFGGLLTSIGVYVLRPSMVTDLGGRLLARRLPTLLMAEFQSASPAWFTLDGLFWFLVTVLAVELWLGFELWLRVTGRSSDVIAFTPRIAGRLPSRSTVRALSLAVVLCSSLVLAVGAATASPSVEPTAGYGSSGELTVVTSQGNNWEANRNAGLPGGIFVLDAAGNVVYRNDSHKSYWDVDPVPNTSDTVVYVASDIVTEDGCPAEQSCVRRTVETLNLSTSATTVLHTSRISKPRGGGNKGMIHDVDLINDTHLLVADIADDRVYILNYRTGEETWSWAFEEEFSTGEDGGGRLDWSHVNDVELLADGRVMISPRNFDRVIFVRPGDGLVPEWTLGAEDEYETLHAQHNPDYLPRDRGGPAVLVADSENDRIVEYQRTDGEWTATWTWNDAATNWPRDADRLPDGSTLVTDTNSNRVFEVGTHGAVVWEVSSIKRPYEAERLGTGDESAGGLSATALSLRSRTVSSVWERAPFGMKAQSVVDGVWFVAPLWFGVSELVAAGAFLLAALALLVDFLLYATPLLYREIGPV